MLAKLGNVIFKPKSLPFSRLQMDRKNVWVEHKALNGSSFLSFTGRSAKKMEIIGSLLPDFHQGLSQLEELHQMSDETQAFPLSLSSKYLGMWFISSLHEERTLFDSEGYPRRIDFKLELLEASHARD